ncbi:MAG: peptidylprolyl isomerase [Betaproteobacteria bacterium]|jgi:FKBP-type peptidyl-prolyl cis-trans isomerase SlyD|nr:peptidylprolyl isomerase [Betaproteobacteria bacterium]
MQIAKDTVVTLKYQLYGTDGELIEETEDPVDYLHGGYGNMFPAVEKELEGKDVGETCRIKLTPDDGFGDYDAELVHVEPQDKFPAGVKVGMQFEGEGDESGEKVVYTVTEIADGKVVVDGNHPLAGQTLNFECTITSVRAASDEELSHGHVHGEHGHHH